MTQPAGNRLVVVGQACVSHPLAMRAPSVGVNVVSVDLDVKRVERLAAGRTPTDEISDDDVYRSAANSMSLGRLARRAAVVGAVYRSVISGKPKPVMSGPDLSTDLHVRDLVRVGVPPEKP